MADAPSTAVKAATPTKTATPAVITKAPGGAITAKATTPTKPGETPKATQTAVRAPIFRITRPQTRTRYLKFMLYGDYGVGKTYLAATSVEVLGMRDVLLLNAESGDLTLETDDLPFENIDRIDITNFTQVARVHDFLKLHCSLRDKYDEESTARLCKIEEQLTGVPTTDPRRYRTVIIDSLREVETYNMYGLLSITESTQLDADIPPEEWSEYKKNKKTVERLVRAFRNLPMHVIMTCPRQYSEDELKKKSYSPDLTGGLARSVQGFMDVVGYMIIGNIAEAAEGTIPRRLYVQPTGRFAAKCRFSSFKGTHFDNPTIESILKAVKLDVNHDQGA